jgi:hypothetical protein
MGFDRGKQDEQGSEIPLARTFDLRRDISIPSSPETDDLETNQGTATREYSFYRPISLPGLGPGPIRWSSRRSENSSIHQSGTGA